MLAGERVPQTLLLSGPEGVGKATLARRMAAMLLGDPDRIELDDLSLPANQAVITDREKWPADKRGDDPLLFSSHPDFLTFPPDGPLRQISIQQIRTLKERATLKPLYGRWRVFLIDRIDRANEQAANSLLKTLEEPPEHLMLIATTQNLYDLLPTIRSRAVPFHLARLGDDAMRAFIRERELNYAERRLALAQGSPGIAISLDLDTYDKRRTAMWKLLEVAAGQAPFAEWAKHSESISSRKTEKLEDYLDVLYLLLEDLVHVANGGSPLRNPDLGRELAGLAARVRFEWIRKAVGKIDVLVELLRRNIQKGLALDALVLELRSA
ncbi:MAG: AAA family ATPase [Bryobacteraceae bacterium]